MRQVYKILNIKTEGNRLVRKNMQRWEDNIKPYLKKTEYENVEVGIEVGIILTRQGTMK